MDFKDEELMLKTAEGDEVAFGELVKRYQSLVINMFYKYVWDVNKAEDLAQEVFIKLFKAAKNYKVSSKFSTFLFRIVKNHIIDNHRKFKNKPKPISYDVDYNEDNKSAMSQNLKGNEENPLNKLISNEKSMIVQDAINQLPEIYKIIIVMGQLENMKYSDIARILDLPVGTVKSRMFLAIRKLKKIMIEIGINDEKV